MVPDRLQPDTVVALCFDEAAVAEEFAQWCGGSVERVPDDGGAVVTTVWVPTEKGPRPARLGDWVVRAGEEHYHVMDPEQFAAQHSPL